MSGKSVLLFGATGTLGKHVLKEVLSSEQFSRVGEYGRRVTSETDLLQLPANRRHKLEQRVTQLDKMDSAKSQTDHWDVIILTIGTTRKKAGSAEEFEKIDREFVLNAAQAAKSNDSRHTQRLIYVSGPVADCCSPTLYIRSKALTELALSKLEYDDLIVFRPAFMTESNTKDDLLSSYSHIPVTTLARSIRVASELGSSLVPANVKAPLGAIVKGSRPYTVIGNGGALCLASHPSEK